MADHGDGEPDPIHLPQRRLPQTSAGGVRQPGATVVSFSPSPKLGAPPMVAFDQRELTAILRVYGHLVAAGEARDYAIDFDRERAAFAIFRRTSEVPLYTIEKRPKLARKQGAYSVVAASGLILKRGQELPAVLDLLERKAFKAL